MKVACRVPLRLVAVLAVAAVPVLIVLTPLVVAADGQEASLPERDELQRRLEQAETRIAVLEELLRRQSEQLETILAPATLSAPAPVLPPPVPYVQEKKATGPATAPPDKSVVPQIASICNCKRRSN